MPNQRFSKKREAILACVRSTDTHPTAEWIFEQLKPQFPDLALGTVYRNLTEFKESGLITSVGVFNGFEHFERNLHPHAHFVCKRCGAVMDAEDAPLPTNMFNNLSCGTVESADVIFKGVCNRCAADSKAI